MADICEICRKMLEHYIDGIVDYDKNILCQRCWERVNSLFNEFDGEKDFEECVEIFKKGRTKE